MEKRLKRIEVITIISLLLIVGNLIYSISKKTNSMNTDTTEIKETKKLPSDITRDYSDKILFKIKIILCLQEVILVTDFMRMA